MSEEPDRSYFSLLPDPSLSWILHSGLPGWFLPPSSQLLHNLTDMGGRKPQSNNDDDVDGGAGGDSIKYNVSCIVTYPGSLPENC